RGRTDLFGRVLKMSIQAYADEVASAANLLSGEAAEGRPVVLVRGLNFPLQEGHASDYNRPLETDLYR
ncbi:MAG: coenzyme F420-0:L-glutamate ligase, partial [Chloroflexota bacterium]